ncbi:MAG TPA: DNA primase [Terriglobales bacterium]|nr:DNA primase [Terriglobales bacterium]
MSTSATDFKETVKQQADIVRIIGDYVKLRKAGAQNFAGLCPFHNEKTPSFSVHATRQFFHCFGCGVSGDVFSFIQKIENLTFPEAVRAVAQKMGIALPKVSFNSPAEAEEAKLRTALLEMHERACDFFQECLRRPEAAHARQYLTERGLSQETIRTFRIGYAPDSGFLLRDRLKGEFPEDLMRESGLFSWKQDEIQPTPNDRAKAALSEAKGSTANDQRPTANDQNPATIYSKFRNRITFPISNESGRIIAFTGRTLSTDEKAGPKYLNSPETAIYSKSRVLFNLDQAKEWIRKFDYVILVEGQMDCISVFSSGFQNVLASSGTAFTELQAKLLARFTKNVIVNFDPDTAGAKATERTLGLLVEEEFNIKVLTLESGFDPDLFIRRQGKDAYAAALRGSQRYFDYLIERARSQFPIRTPEGKVKAVNYLLPHIQRVPSRIVRDELAGEIAQKIGIDSSVLRQELKHVVSSRSAAQLKVPTEIQVTAAEKLLIRALASSTQMSSEEHLSARDGAEDEFDPARQARYALSSEHLHHGLATEGLIDLLLHADEISGDVMDLPLSQSDRNLMASILMNEDEELSAIRLEGAVKALRRIQLRRRLDTVQKELQSGKVQQTEHMQELLQEKVRLKRALMDPGVCGSGNDDNGLGGLGAQKIS